MFTRHLERGGRRAGGIERRRERGARAICVRGKQAESPVRGKFTPVWLGAEVEERKERSCRGHSGSTGAAVPFRAACAACAFRGKKGAPWHCRRRS